MSRSKNFINNAIWELGYYLIVIALGFLAPRYIILTYGSEVNGLSSTITQILNVILLLQSGATTAAVYWLFKPIADNNIQDISKRIASSENFFKKISIVFAVAMLVVAVVTSLLIDSELDSRFIFIAFVIMGFKSFLDLFFTSKFRIVFTAFQQKYIISIATLIEQVIYYTLVFLTIYLKIHFLFLYLSLFLGCVVRVVYLEIEYTKKYRNLIPRYTGEVNKIPGRTHSFANEVSHSVVGSSIIVMMSLMYGLKETSVYSVYVLVSSALSLVSTALYSAFAPSFGNLAATEDKENSSRVFAVFQYLYVMLNTFLFMCMLYMMMPFVSIYTKGVTDINYTNLMLACLLSLQGIMSAYRIPYNVVVSSYGFFKETWAQPVICAVLSIALSFVFGRFNYSFVLIGPIIFYLINFIYQHFRLKKLVPHLISDRTFVLFVISCIGFALTAVASNFSQVQEGIIAWICTGIVYASVAVIYLVVMSLIFDRKDFVLSVGYVKRLLGKRRSNG
jgi:O-antigen/teichoic acid export membrane protein